MLNMIKHGAQDIIHTCDDEDEDMAANIDKILAKSEEKTNEINKQLNSVEDKFNLNQVSLAGGDDGQKTSVYIFEGENVPVKQI